MWNRTAFTERLEIDYPIIQGPFGGGLSSTKLAAIVSNAGGLGSFGAEGLTPGAIAELVTEMRSLTTKPFAVNLWIPRDIAPPPAPAALPRAKLARRLAQTGSPLPGPH